jgi:cytochrome c-type biogenesis protein CcsB
MASTIEARDSAETDYGFPQTSGNSVGRAVLAVLKFLASLKITVVLFALAVIIVFVGTLAQTRHDIWVVVREYFRSWYVMVPFKVFFPPSWSPDWEPTGFTVPSFVPYFNGRVIDSFPFLGGWSIGALMAVNLIAAHLVRFRAQARGAKLAKGLSILAIGVLVTTVVILGGNGTKFQVTPLIDPSMRILWQLIQATFAGLVLLAGCWPIFGKRAGIVLLHGGVGLMMFSELWVGTTAVEAQMHIVEGETVNFLQDIRTNELAVIDETEPGTEKVVAIPQRFLMDDETIRHEALPFDLRIVEYQQNSELHGVEPGDKNPATAGFGKTMIARKAKAGVGTSADSKVDESALYVQVLKKGTTESLGTYLTTLLQTRLSEARLRTGLSETEIRSRYRIGPFVLKLCQPTEFECAGKKYRLALRFKRTYEPYAMKLEDVRFDKYIGTNTPKNYSSKLHLVDPSRDVDENVTISMNNPLRFAGQTFYQSSVGNDPVTGAETTGLQVVTNAGWMIPYVSCMIIVVGMLFQFGITLLRFLDRQTRSSREIKPFSKSEVAGTGGADSKKGPSQHDRHRRKARRDVAAAANATGGDFNTTGGPVRSIGETALLATVALGFVLMLGKVAMPPKAKEGDFDYYAAGSIPIVADGRIKPLDSLARNTLQVLSTKETYYEPVDGYKATTDVENPEVMAKPAMRWLLDLIAGTPDSSSHRVFRIDNPEVLGLFDLDRHHRKSHLFSLDEIRGQGGKNLKKYEEELEKVRKKPTEKMEPKDRKLLELDRRIRAFTAVAFGFLDHDFTRPQMKAVDEDVRRQARLQRASFEPRLDSLEQRLLEGHPPLAVPVREGKTGSYDWKPYYSAYMRDAFEAKLLGDRDPRPLVDAWDAILTAYANDRPADFNRAVKKYLELVRQESPPDLSMFAVRFEAYFNSFAPFVDAWILYIAAFVLSVLAWLGWSGPLNRAAFLLTVLTFALHTCALIARMYISGRPPVTNLYSTAPFIGWGCVVGGLIFERLFRVGIGNLVSSIAGFATLLISFKLSGDGDTFTVMQAVLDTQFWLATHVVCINLGYAPTFLAGLLGAIYILQRAWSLTAQLITEFIPILKEIPILGHLLQLSVAPETEKVLGRMIYGTLCFAIFFSFFGTVLGGLWADDSWGRFWGWDPKENGALMIVLWNALILHARWGGMVKDRGIAILAVFGNIVTAWSWFGVNELGVGLHSYGFTEGVLKTLRIFMYSQLAVIGIGSLPRALWLSFRGTPPADAEEPVNQA